MPSNRSDTPGPRVAPARTAAAAATALELERDSMERVRLGDRAAFRVLYDATSPAIFTLLVRMMRSRARAEEVLVDTYAQAWELRERFDATRGTPTAWLVTLARTRAIDRLRADARDRVVCQGDGSWIDALLAPDAENLTELERFEEAVRVDAALAVLPTDQGRLVRAAFYGGLSHSEISLHEGLPLGTVKSRIRAGLAQLRLLLAEQPSAAAASRPKVEGTSR